MKSRSVILCVVALLLMLFVGPVQAEHTPLDAAAGRLLVANEGMTDPRFAESVILLLQHNRAGSLGLILNNRSDIVPDVVPEELVPNLHHVYFGGPIEPLAVSILVLGKKPPEASRRVTDDIHLTGLEEIISLMEQGEKARFRLFFGYSGWAPGQLEMELAHGSWRVYPADKRILFQDNVEHLWEQLMTSGPVLSL